ncbi:MAG: DUF5615 family PIN-like protein [Planctomycetota bacterium]
MKLKLDENLSRRTAELFRAAGHDATTVFDQGLASAVDRSLIDHCRDEGRALVTLDLDFSNPFVFPPGEYPGIAVFRLPRNPTSADIDRAAQVLISALVTEKLDRKLWIVEPTRIRLYRPERDDDWD